MSNGKPSLQKIIDSGRKKAARRNSNRSSKIPSISQELEAKIRTNTKRRSSIENSKKSNKRKDKSFDCGDLDRSSSYEIEKRIRDCERLMGSRNGNAGSDDKNNVKNNVISSGKYIDRGQKNFVDSQTEINIKNKSSGRYQASDNDNGDGDRRKALGRERKVKGAKMEKGLCPKSKGSAYDAIVSLIKNPSGGDKGPTYEKIRELIGRSRDGSRRSLPRNSSDPKTGTGTKNEYPSSREPSYDIGRRIKDQELAASSNQETPALLPSPVTKNDQNPTTLPQDPKAYHSPTRTIPSQKPTEGWDPPTKTIKTPDVYEASRNGQETDETVKHSNRQIGQAAPNPM
jgi:hypothetical protein